jgi:hypothetical protein
MNKTTKVVLALAAVGAIGMPVNVGLIFCA